MNKKVLLSSIVASSLAVALMVAPKASQSTTSIGLKNGEALSSSVYRVDGKTISIILPPNNSYALTKKDLTNLLVKYYNTKVSKVYKMNGEEVLKETDTIGTGYVVELESKSKVEVVIYGDVNGDGLIDTNDTIAVAKYNVSNSSIKNSAQLKAATLVKKESGVNTIDTGDTVRIAYYNVGAIDEKSKYGKEIVDSEIYESDESNIVFDLNEIDVKNIKVEETVAPEEKEDKQVIETEIKEEDKQASEAEAEEDKKVPESEVKKEKNENEVTESHEDDSKETEPENNKEPQNVESQNKETQNVEPQNKEPQKVETQNEENQEVEPQETEPEKTEPEEVKPQETEIKKTEEVKPQENEMDSEKDETSNSNETVEVPQKHEHTFTDWKITVEANCIQKGEKVRECTECGEIEKEEVIALNAHKTIKLEDEPATCEKYGKENFSRCEYCKAEFFSIVPALGHEYSSNYTVDKAPSCESTGSESRHCIHDGCTSNIEQREIEAKGHNLITEVKKATCTESEITTTKCSNCNYSVSEKTAEAIGHKFSDYKKNNDATCTIDGTKTAKCENCGEESTIIDEGSKLGHKYISLDNAITPTCISNGKEADKECENCGNHITGKTIKSTGHEFLLKALSLEEAEEEGVECVKCHLKVGADDIISGEGHKWNDTFTKCECEECKEKEENNETDVWWKTWEKGMENEDDDLLAACIWFVGFKANTEYCEGFYDYSSRRNVDHLIEGRRGDIKNIKMTAPNAREGYVFDGWYDLSNGEDGTRVERTSGDNNMTYVDENNQLIVSWKDMEKVFEARYKRVENDN